MKESNAIGMYLGMAVGDAIGAPWEFTKPTPLISWQEIEMRTGGPHDVSLGEWTDDTALARCLTDCYQRFGRLIPEACYENFAEWENTGKFGTRDHIFDIGITTMTAIGNYKLNQNGRTWFGVDDQHAQGNGGIMRLAPIIIANWQDQNACRLDAIKSSMLTHASEECLRFADRLANDLWRGRTNQSMESLFQKVTNNSGHVRDTYFSAWKAVKSTGCFEDAIKYAVCRGNDADTVGAVAGMIAGRIYGIESIPSKWLDALMMKDVLFQEAQDLYRIGSMR